MNTYTHMMMIVQWRKSVVCKCKKINSGFGAFYLPFRFLSLASSASTSTSTSSSSLCIHAVHSHSVRRNYFWMCYAATWPCIKPKPLYSSIYLNRFRLSFHIHKAGCQPRAQQQKQNETIFGDRLKFTITTMRTHSFNHVWHILIFVVICFVFFYDFFPLFPGLWTDHRRWRRCQSLALDVLNNSEITRSTEAQNIFSNFFRFEIPFLNRQSTKRIRARALSRLWYSGSRKRFYSTERVVRWTVCCAIV